MKQKIALLLFSLFATAGAFAQGRNYTVLKLRLSDQSPLSVNLDGRFIDRGTTSLTLDGIRPGWHRIEVYSEVNYRRRPVRVYTGTLRLQASTVNIGVVDVYNRGLRLRTRPAYDHDGYDDRFDEGSHQQDNDASDSGSWNNEYGREDGRSRNDDVYDNDRNNARNGEDGYGSFPHGRSNNTASQNNRFSDRDMEDLLSRVAGRITDSDKEQLMKTALEDRTVYTGQVRRMLSALSFDDTKLDFAKWAYSHAEDRQDYWKLEDAFSFSSTKDAFNRAIRSR
jgi:hypothetical protein